MSGALYGELIADHARNPRNRGVLDSPDAAHEGVNPLCGDRVRIELRVRSGRIEAMRFEAEACMVTVAAASVLSELLSGIAVQSARAIAESDVLTALRTELRPSRTGCALLPLQVMRGALEKLQ
jgi:nitrogen fixation protein NifU and related proteins